MNLIALQTTTTTSRRFQRLAGSVTVRDRERFWTKVDRSGECWEWLSTKNPKGYGRFSVTVSPATPRQHWYSAHRLAWSWENESETGELCVCHRCDNPGCVNPAHLFLGTDLDNARDRDAKGRRLAPIGEANGRAKLTAAEVESIRAEFAAARPRAELALQYGVSRKSIDDIIARRTWKAA